MVQEGERKEEAAHNFSARSCPTASSASHEQEQYPHCMKSLKRKRRHSGEIQTVKQDNGSSCEVDVETNLSSPGELDWRCADQRSGNSKANRKTKKRIKSASHLETEPESRFREDSPSHESGIDGVLPLSRQNLRFLNRLTKPSMASIAPSLKRNSSQLSGASVESDTTRRRSSASNAAFYRYKHLSAVQIHIHSDPPNNIEKAIDKIIGTDVKNQRFDELRHIARGLRLAFLNNVKAQSGEDNFVHPLYSAIASLNLRNIILNEKAEWRNELLPSIQQHKTRFDFSFMAEKDPPRPTVEMEKRQHLSSELYISPEPSCTSARVNVERTNMMPPPLPPSLENKTEQYPVKLPRPDITIGTELSSVIAKLSGRSLNETEARVFLDWLQAERLDKPNGKSAPVLLPVPALRALNLAFPFAVIEGKAYSTGKQIFEAENQGAVSASCALKIQTDLDELVSRAKGRATSSSAVASAAQSTEPTLQDITAPPLFFSITTQGPIHELWAHWTVVKDEIRMFESKLIDSCNALLVNQAEQFMVKVNNVCVWGTGPFIDSVVRRLELVAKKAKI